jgi:hypothetical protein
MLIAKQHSAFSGFAYDLYDQENQKVGTLCWPDIAVAKNARIQNPVPDLLSSTIEIKYNSHLYLVEFEYLTREWFNNIRFTLLDEGVTLASADFINQKKLFKRPQITITEPFTGEVVRKSGLLAIRYEVIKNGVLQGTIAEKSGLTVKRELHIDLPGSISSPVQLFILFLVHNHAYR